MSIIIGVCAAIISYLTINAAAKAAQQRHAKKLNEKYIKEIIVFDDSEHQTTPVEPVHIQKKDKPVENKYTLSADSKKVTKTVEYHETVEYHDTIKYHELKIKQPDSKASIPRGELFTVRDYNNNFIGYVLSIEGPSSYHTVSGEFEVRDPTVLQYFYNCINSGLDQNRIKFSLIDTKYELTGCLVTAIHQDDINERMAVTIVADKMNIKHQDVKAKCKLWDDSISVAWNKTHTCNIPMRTSLSSAYCGLYGNQWAFLKE